MDGEIEFVFALGVSGLSIGVMLVFLVRWYRRMPRRQFSFAEIPLPTIGAFDGRDVACSCEHACEKHQRRPESMVIGSNFTKVPIARIPKVQVALYSVNEQGKAVQYLGSGVRIDEWLVVPTHIVIPHMVLGAMVMRGKEMATSYKIDTTEFVRIEGDLSALRMSEADFSKLGLVKASIASVEGETMASVCTSTKDPEMAFGTLLNDTKVFGAVVFCGSTRGGFSGAPYMVGSHIAGVHLGGGVMNYGMSASYIRALLIKPEDTAEWLQRVRRKAGPIKYQRSKFNPDEAVVFVGGRYHTVDLSVLEDRDVQEDTGRYAVAAIDQPEKIPEVNTSECFPPQYQDTAEFITSTVNEMVAQQQQHSLNLEAAEEISAEQLSDFTTWYQSANQKLSEVNMLLQTLQNGVVTRYQEVEKLLTQVPKESTVERATLVTENERLKKELTEIKKLKTDVNVETSSIKAKPLKIKKAAAKKEGAALLDKVAAQFSVDEIIKALELKGLVTRNVAAEGITAPVVEVPQVKSILTSPSTSQK